MQALATGLYIVDLDIGQALGAVDLDELLVCIDFATRQAAFAATAGNAQCHHATIFHRGRIQENLELNALHELGQLGEFELDAQVGLVGSVLEHGVAIGHDGKHRQVDIGCRTEHTTDHAFEHFADFFLAHERGFDVDLREFRLAIGPQVFIAEAFDDLVIAVVASHHQQLLEELRRLWQRKKAAVVHTARHQVIARAFGCRLAQHRRFDVDEAVGIEELAGFHRDLVAQHQVALHGWAAQIEHAVREAGRFAQVVIVEQERWRDRRVQHLQFLAQDFDPAALEVLVDSAFGARTHQALDLDAKLVAQVFGNGEDDCAIRIAHHLHITFAVAHVDEDDAAMITPTIDPAAQGHGFAQQGIGHKTTVMRTHSHKRIPAPV